MDVIMPQLGETVAEGTVTRWYKQVGDTVKADEPLFDVETDKVSTEIPAPVAGTLESIVVGAGVTAKVGATIAVIRKTGDTPAAPAKGTSGPVAAPAVPTPLTGRPALAPRTGDYKLSPVVRRLLAEHGLDPRDVRASGRDGRVTRDDVLAHVAGSGNVTAHPGPAVAPASAPAAAAPVTLPGDRILPFNAIRSKTAARMAGSWAVSPHVLQVVEVDFQRVDKARAAAGAAWKAREGFVLSYLPFILRAVSIALGKFPNVNASFTPEGLLVRARIDIGIAVDLALDGLVVPVLKNVPGKSLPQIAREIADLAKRARENRLKPDDLAGGTYTVTNNGAFGTVITAPIINQPQIAILSTDAIRKKPVVIEGADGDTIAIRPVGVLAQTFDHRAIDGAYAASYLAEVKRVLETRDWLQDLEA
jgi:2-oxoglutarate dehydrogenase E2 component (dihydrolipoamide succinyltransferase)